MREGEGRDGNKMVLFSFSKGIYSKRREFALLGSKFFLFRVDPILE